jgi:type I restriction enzyme M protein
LHLQNFIRIIGFHPKENVSDIYIKKYTDGYSIELDIIKQIIHFGGKIKVYDKDFQNITKPEDWVVLECVDNLLTKGYKPENIQLEKVYPSGHGTSGRLDICVTREDGSEYLLIECKTYGKEFEKEFSRMKKDGGQLFTYFKFSNKADVIMLYSSELQGDKVEFRNEIVKIEDDYRTGDVKDFYDKWNKLPKNNGVFDAWVNPYNFESKALTINDLVEIKQEDSSFIFNSFLEILRHNVVSDKPNAFNKIFTLFLCKIYDEKEKEGTEKELDFQWLEGKDDDVSFQLRLTDLYKNGMEEFLEKQVTDFSDEDLDSKYASLFAGDENLKSLLRKDIARLRLEKNNEFAIKEVYDHKSFIENAKVVKEVVKLLEKFKIRYTQKQQYLSDFFELLLTTGLKQESGQFFTPVPIAQFIIKSLPIDQLVEEKLMAGKRDELLPYIIDYAAGSGHFLTESMHEIQRLILKTDPTNLKSEAKSFIEVSKIRHFDWALQYVYGIEKDYRLVKVGKVGCYLHGDGLANVIHSDGLANFKHKEYKNKLSITQSDFPNENQQFDVLVSNPPYSVSAFKNSAREYYRDGDFELYDRLTDNSSEIECLFIERTKQLLKDGGVAGIILPSSILSNTGIYSKSREIILQYFDIVAITELGSNTFMATGTNTVTLFLRRRKNYESKNLKIAVDKFFTDFLDVTLNGIEKPVTKYVNHVWEGLTFDDYVSLLKKTPNKAVAEHEIYKEYQKKIKAKNDKEFWSLLLAIETEKLYYFIIAYPQKVVLVKSGEKDAEKRFLGYEFSNRRGNEGIHPMQRGKNIEDCTQLFDADVFDNPSKASTYIYKAFAGDYDFAIDEAMQNNVTRHNLIDMLTFDRVEFEKNISTTIKKKVISKWKIVNIGEVCDVRDGTHESPKFVQKGFPLITSKNITKDFLDFSNVKHISKADFDQINKRSLVEYGDILYAMIGTIGFPVLVNTTEEFAIKNVALFKKDKSNLLNNKYLKEILNYSIVKDQILNEEKGSNRKFVSLAILRNLKIPLPPLDIQQKIVSEIEVLEAKEKKAKEEVEKLKNSIPDLIESLKDNKLERLENLCTIGSGGTPSMKIQEYWENGNVPWLKSEVCKEGFVYEAKEFITELGLQKSNAKYFEENSTLIALVGATKGKTAFLKFKATTNQNIAGIKSLNNLNILDLYVFYVLKGMYNEIIKDLGQYDMLNLTQIRNIKIPLPPISEQQKIVAEIEKIEAKINSLETQIASIPKEKEAVLKKYL